MLFISQSSHLIALIMFTSICDDFLLLLILLSLIELPRAELNESDLGEPGVLALALQRPWTGSWLVRIEVGGRQRQEAKGRHDWEESAPTKPILDRLEKVRGSNFCHDDSETSHPAHESCDEVVDDVPAEEEGVDEPPVLVTKCLHCNCWLS